MVTPEGTCESADDCMHEQNLSFHACVLWIQSTGLEAMTLGEHYQPTLYLHGKITHASRTQNHSITSIHMRAN